MQVADTRAQKSKPMVLDDDEGDDVFDDEVSFDLRASAPCSALTDIGAFSTGS